MNQKIIKNTLILTAITLISGLLLGFVYEITKEPIAASRENRKQEAYHTVFQEAETFQTFEAFEEKEAEEILKNAGVSVAMSMKRHWPLTAGKVQLAVW